MNGIKEEANNDFSASSLEENIGWDTFHGRSFANSLQVYVCASFFSSTCAERYDEALKFSYVTKMGTIENF